MYTEEQRAITENADDNILLLARAGAGKTFTVASRVAEAIKSGIKPEEVLCLTFTVKAAGELSDAVFERSGSRKAEISTIHGFCYELIKREYLKRGIRAPEVADEVDCGEVILSILDDYAKDGELEEPDGRPSMSERQLFNLFSLVKHKREDLGYGYFSESGYGEALRALAGKKSYEDLFICKKNGVKITDYPMKEFLAKKGEEFCIKYKRKLSAAFLMDFDDLLFCAKSLTEEAENPYKLVVMDEMQDTTALEYSIARRFFKGAQVILCGDPYQTIYGWRGSEPKRIIEDFKNNFNARTFTLGENRRSSPLLSYAGEYYLAKTFGGELPEKKTDGEKIKVYACADKAAEAERIFSLVKNFDGDPTEICVMARSNRYIADVSTELEKINAALPPEERKGFFTADSDFQFFKRPVVKDFLAALKIALNPYDEVSFMRLAKKLGVSDGELAALKDYSVIGITTGAFFKDGTYSDGDPYLALKRAYENNSVAVYDTETTGLVAGEDEIIQISAVKTGKDGITDTFSRFIIPNREISPAALASHGYDLDYIKSHGGEDAKTALADFAEFTRGCVLAGYNSAKFDDAFLFEENAKYGVNSEIIDLYDVIDIAKAFSPDLADKKLSSVCEALGVVNERAHDALADALATAECLSVYYNKYILPSEEDRRRILILKRDLYGELLPARKEILSLIDGKDARGAVKFINDKFGLLKTDRQSDRDTANDFFKAFKEIEKSEAPRVFAADFVSSAALASSQLDAAVKKLGKVPLITVHQSKGCEFKEVIVAGAGEDEFPTFGAKLSGNEDEEKRIFYVATTRAKEKLVFTYAIDPDGRGRRQRGASPYIYALPKEAVEYF